MQTERDRSVGTRWGNGAALVVLLLTTACGGGAGGVDTSERVLSAKFHPGPTPFAIEATVEVPDVQSLADVAFTIRSKPGSLSRDVRVTYDRAYLEREGAIDESQGTVSAVVFGLYADYANLVTIETRTLAGQTARAEFVLETGPLPDSALPELDVHSVRPGLGLNYLLLQGFGPPTIVDIDGEVRWQAPDVGEEVFPRAQTPEGMVVGSLFSNAIFEIDWLGRVRASVLSDPRCVLSHHNIERGKQGLLNTVTFRDGSVRRPESVLAEMSSAGVVSRLWDFDDIFRNHILALGEDPSGMVADHKDWFHMNSAIYDAADDSIIASSRENFVVKVDYQTGAIKWLMGNPAKDWYQDFPASLQPLALTIIGDAPIGQHSLALSADGTRLLLFNNGKGNLTLDDVGDSRQYSKVSAYRIDEVARTAEEVWHYDFGQAVYSPYRSSACWTEAGNVLIVCSSPADGSPDQFVVIDQAMQVLFDAQIVAAQKGYTYSAAEIRLEALRLN